MTQLKDMAAPVHQAPPVLDGATLREAMSRYLANPVFRAARYEELVLDDNPYRRPVRPDDIGFVDFSEPLRRDNFSRLSGLMGHRMLLNIHDTRTLLMPAEPTEEKWVDFQQFYDEGNRMLGDIIRPSLEEHLFSFVRAEAAEHVTGDVAALTARIADISARQSALADALAALVAGSPYRESLAAMVAIQSVATALNARHMTQAELPAPLRGVAEAGTLDELGQRVAAGAGVKYEPHSHFQYYLPSTLGLMNYLSGAAQDPGRAFRLVGALIGQRISAAVEPAVEPAMEPAMDGRSGVPAQRTDAPSVAHIVAEVERVGGGYAVRELSRGLEEYAVLLEVQHDDFTQQFTWINAMSAYAEKAERLQRAIDEHRIPVQLDTFVESWEECSTTHVHDDDRLLVIESGQMDFWNCLGARHTYRPGDKAFIPKHRLHGSVVLTGECVYHQPVITPELDARFG